MRIRFTDSDEVMDTRKVIIIDDDEGFVDALELFLEDRGFNVTKAYTGVEGRDKLAHGRFDIAIIDVNLPDVGGLDIVRTAWASATPIPTIVISSDDSQQTQGRSRDAGAEAFLPKPIAPHELVQAISSVLANGRKDPADFHP